MVANPVRNCGELDDSPKLKDTDNHQAADGWTPYVFVILDMYE